MKSHYHKQKRLDENVLLGESHPGETAASLQYHQDQYFPSQNRKYDVNYKKANKVAVSQYGIYTAK